MFRSGIVRRAIASLSSRTVLGLLLMVCTTAEVLYYSHVRPDPSLDEVNCSVSTVNFVISNRRPVLFLYGASYMAPLLEMAVVPFCALTKSAPLPPIRAAGALFLGFSVLLLFQSLTIEFGLLLSSVVAVAYAIGTPWLLFWNLKMPGHPAGLFCCFGFLFVFIKFKPSAFFLGLLAGLLHYIYPISIAFIITAFATMFDGDELFNALAGRLRTAFCSNRLGSIFSFGLLTAIALLGAGVVYRILTGRLKGTGAALALGASLLLGLVAYSNLLFLLHKNRPFDLQSGRRILARPVIFMLGFSCIEIPVQAVFRYIEAPYFSIRGVQLWSGDVYSLKPWPAWPKQVLAYLDRILPQAFVPISPRDWMPLYQGAGRPRITVVFGIMSLFALVTAARRLHRHNLARSGHLDACTADPDRVPLGSVLSRPSGVLFAAFTVMSVLLIPSWRLFGDPSVRYLTAYFPGIYVAVAVLIRDFVGLRWRFKSESKPRIIQADSRII